MNDDEMNIRSQIAVAKRNLKAVEVRMMLLCEFQEAKLSDFRRLASERLTLHRHITRLKTQLEDSYWARRQAAVQELIRNEEGQI